MGLFSTPYNDTWQEHLRTMRSNSLLLEQHQYAEYLFTFMEVSLRDAKKAYYKEFPDKKPPGVKTE